MKQDISWLLEQWGIWARQDGLSKVGYPQQAPFARDPTNHTPLMITDEDAMKIDSEICKLKSRYTNESSVINCYYAGRMTIRQTATKLGVDKNAVWRDLLRAQKMLSNRLGSKKPD